MIRLNKSACFYKMSHIKKVTTKVRSKDCSTVLLHTFDRLTPMNSTSFPAVILGELTRIHGLASFPRLTNRNFGHDVTDEAIKNGMNPMQLGPLPSLVETAGVKSRKSMPIDNMSEARVNSFIQEMNGSPSLLVFCFRKLMPYFMHVMSFTEVMFRQASLHMCCFVLGRLVELACNKAAVDVNLVLGRSSLKDRQIASIQKKLSEVVFVEVPHLKEPALEYFLSNPGSGVKDFRKHYGLESSLSIVKGVRKLFESLKGFPYDGLTNTYADLGLKFGFLVLFTNVQYRAMMLMSPKSLLSQIQDHVEANPELKSNRLVSICLEYADQMMNDNVSQSLKPNGVFLFVLSLFMLAFGMKANIDFQVSVMPTEQYRKAKSNWNIRSMFLRFTGGDALITPDEFYHNEKLLVRALHVVEPYMAKEYDKYCANTHYKQSANKFMSLLRSIAKYAEHHPKMKVVKDRGVDYDSLLRDMNYSDMKECWKGIRAITHGKHAHPVNILLQVSLSYYYKGTIPLSCPSKSVLHNMYIALDTAARLQDTKYLMGLLRKMTVPGAFAPVFDDSECSDTALGMLPIPTSSPDTDYTDWEIRGVPRLYQRPAKNGKMNSILHKGFARDMSLEEAWAILGYKNGSEVNAPKFMEDFYPTSSYYVRLVVLCAGSPDSPFKDLPIKVPVRLLVGSSGGRSTRDKHCSQLMSTASDCVSSAVSIMKGGEEAMMKEAMLNRSSEGVEESGSKVDPKAGSVAGSNSGSVGGSESG